MVGLAAASVPLARRLARRPALDATEAIGRVLDEIELLGGDSVFDVGSPLKGASAFASELARFLDPTLLTLEGLLFESYCKASASLQAFNKKCKGLDEPAAHTGNCVHSSHAELPRPAGRLVPSNAVVDKSTARWRRGGGGARSSCLQSAAP